VHWRFLEGNMVVSKAKVEVREGLLKRFCCQDLD
jgi:hypothetical protein